MSLSTERNRQSWAEYVETRPWSQRSNEIYDDDKVDDNNQKISWLGHLLISEECRGVVLFCLEAESIDDKSLPGTEAFLNLWLRSLSTFFFPFGLSDTPRAIYRYCCCRWHFRSFAALMVDDYLFDKKSDFVFKRRLAPSGLIYIIPNSYIKKLETMGRTSMSHGVLSFWRGHAMFIFWEVWFSEELAVDTRECRTSMKLEVIFKELSHTHLLLAKCRPKIR